MGRCWEKPGKTKGKKGNLTWENCGTGAKLGKMWARSGKDPGVMWEYFGNTMGTRMGMAGGR